MGGRSYDPVERRRAQRRARQRGCSVYIPVEELAKTGIDLDGPPPAYRVWGSSRGRIVIQLYKEV
jgi:hypothetical protein